MSSRAVNDDSMSIIDYYRGTLQLVASLVIYYHHLWSSFAIVICLKYKVLIS